MSNYHMFGRRFARQRARDPPEKLPLPTNVKSVSTDAFTDHVNEVAHLPSDEKAPPLEETSTELAPLTSGSLRALRRLAAYKAPRDRWPMTRRAAVLVALFGGRHGDLYVVLSKRSEKLRSYVRHSSDSEPVAGGPNNPKGGDTALPGGKLEPNDLDLNYCARREAYEEIGLPINPESIRYLCSLRPFLTRSRLIVTPIVVYILDPFLRPELNADEVDSVFAHPIESFIWQLPREPVLHGLSEDVQKLRRPYHSSWDLPWFHSKPYRWHRFESKRHAILGFTADILIEVAEIAYGKAEFDRKAPGQLSRRRLIDIALQEEPIFRQQPMAEDQAEGAAKAKL